MSPTPTTTSAGPTVAPVIPRQRAAGERLPARRRFAAAGLLICGIAVLLVGYLRMARTNGTNADGAANALQAWDLLHGNLGLAGWTLSDVSFYPTELVQYALIELVYGLDQNVVHVAAAITYVLLIVFAALVAREGATGRAAWARVGVVVAVLLVPSPGSGFATVLNVPDHTGTAVPLLLAALLFGHRVRLGRWWPVAVTVVLTLAQVGDPLAMYIGALPLATVSALRLLRAIWTRAEKGPDARLLVAAAASVALSHAAVRLIGLAGGYRVHTPIAEFTTWDAVPDHVMLMVRTTALDYGAYFPHLTGHHPALTLLYQTAGVVKLLLMAAALLATVVSVARLLSRRGHGDRVAQWLAVAIAVNLAAYVASTQAGDMASARQVVAVLPFGAVLAARVFGDRLARIRVRGRIAAGALAAVLVAAFGAQAAVARPAPIEAAEAAAWLEAHDLRYGVGAYWASNTVTLATHGRVRVAPVTDPVPRAFHWESRAEWFDAARHDARFVIIDTSLEHYGTVSGAVIRFGPPKERVDLGRWTILVYDHNLLRDLPVPHRPAP
ncbi:hypothetical protein [Dactylosporangium salmoneum]|uniref:Glycosyltransferase RgtA/B/C/D-like domain-containing protein n=1 Tax=Dactylosporangium salmoneum TaxID=53361 RepID=A0ABP5UPA0_9ACTN